MKLRKSCFFVFLLLIGCIEPFDTNLEGDEVRVLVVDGVVTNNSGPYTVKISEAFSLNEADIPAMGAEVFINELNGAIEQLTEVSEGVYQTTNMKGEQGNSYRLEFSYKGRDYQSTWEPLLSSPAIDSVYFRNEEIETTDEDDPLRGVQLYVDNNGTDEDSRYFRYEWTETWEYQLCLPSFFEYLGNDLIRGYEDERQFHTCWISDNSAEINLANTVGLSANRLANHKLGFIQGEDQRFTRTYSALVKQFALNEQEFLFWNKLQDNISESGNLFEKQPARTIGNIRNLNDPNSAVLGYFSASGLQESRIFIGPREVFPLLAEKPVCNPPCNRTEIVLKSEFGEDYDDVIFAKLAQGKVYYNIIQDFFTGEPLGSALVEPECADCRLRGGSTTKPDFWND